MEVVLTLPLGQPHISHVKAGETITNTYNDWNLPVLQQVTGTNPDTNETRTDTRSFTYDNLGRKISATNESGTATYEYDDFGHMTKETDVTGAVKEYTYDENGNRLTFKLTVNGAQQMNATYTYDKLNQLTDVTIGGDTTTYGYDENGNIVNKTTGALVTTYAYNAGNLLTEMETTHPNQAYPVSEYTATHYLDGNVKEKQGSDWAYYTYDGLGQLKSDYNGYMPTDYTYDAYGNISHKEVQIAGPEYDIIDYTYNANNQLVQSDEEHVNYMYNETGPLTITRYVYDANGNLTSKTPQILGEGSINSGMSLSLIGEVTQEQLGYYMKVEQYAYNGFGQLTHAAVNDKLAEYAYNPDGLRVSKTVNGETTTHILDGANVVADVTSGNISKYNRGRELISMEQNGDKGYYLFNGHGDVTRLIGEDAREKFYRVVTAYGETVLSGSEDVLNNPFIYAGEYTDAETGNIYLRARYYDPSTGRFVSEDPIKDGTNWYAYCYGNPVIYIDPWGTDAYVQRYYEPKYKEVVPKRMSNKMARDAQLEIYSMIKFMTQDTIELGADGKITITERFEGDLTDGTLLLRELVDSDRTTVFRHSASSTEMIDDHAPFDQRIELPEIGKDYELIRINPQGTSDNKFYVYDSKTNEVITEGFNPIIALAHEMIHVYHSQNGYFLPFSITGTTDRETYRAEELLTVGLNFVGSNGISYYPSQMQTKTGRPMYTENRFREQFGFNLRVQYTYPT